MIKLGTTTQFIVGTSKNIGLTRSMRAGLFLVALIIFTTANCAFACTTGFRSITQLPYEGAADVIDSSTPTVGSEAPCDNLAPASRGRWYHLDPTVFFSYNTLYFDTCTNVTNVDIIIQIYTTSDGSCVSPVCRGIAFDNALAGSCEIGSFNIVAPSLHHWIYVTSYGTELGPFSIKVGVQPFSRPFPSVTMLEYVGQSFYGDTAQNGIRASPSCPDLVPAQIGIFYGFYAQYGASFTASACAYASINHDMKLTVYRRSGTCNSGACYTCQRPIDVTGVGQCEVVDISLVVGESVYFFVSGISAQYNVSFYFGIESNLPPPPAATPFSLLPSCLTGQVLSFDTPVTRALSTSISATTTFGFSSTCAGETMSSSQRGHWFRLPEGITGTIYLSTCDSATSFDTLIMTYAANGIGCQTCNCPTCFAGNDNRNSTYSSLCTTSRSVLMLRLDESTTTRPVYVFVGAALTTTTSGTYRLTMTRRNLLVSSSVPVSEESINNSSTNIGAIVGGSVGGFVFFVFLVALIVGCSRRARYARGRAVVMSVTTPPQQASVVVTQQQQVSTFPVNQPMYVNSVEMQPMQQPPMGQPMYPMQPQGQMPPSYYT